MNEGAAAAVPPAQRISSAGWYCLTLVALTQMMSLLDRNILAILAPNIKADLGIGDAELGLLYGTVFALFYALFSLPLGRLADGWIRTKLLAICIAFWSVSTSLAAFASGFALLALSRLGVGIGEAAAAPAGTSLVYDHFPKARRGLAMAVMAAAIAVGLGLSSVLGGVAADWWDARYPDGAGAPLGFAGWQFAFFLASLPGLVLAGLLWRMKEPVRGAMDGIASPPDPHPFRASAGVLGAVTPGTNWLTLWHRGADAKQWTVNIAGFVVIVGAMVAAVTAAQAFSPRPSLDIGGISINPHALQWTVIGFGFLVLLNLLQSLRMTDRPVYAVLATSPSMVLCILIGSFQTMINYGIMGFTPAFIMQSYGLSPSETGVQFGLLAAALGIVGPMIAGPFSDWINHRIPGAGRVWVVLAALGLSPLVGVWVYQAADVGSFYLRFTLYSLILTMWLPPLYAVMYDQALPRMRGITASTYIIVSTIFGLGMGPYTVGLVSDAYGGDLGTAIVSINWIAPLIVVLLIVLGLRVQRDEDGLLERARAAGEPV